MRSRLTLADLGMRAKSLHPIIRIEPPPDLAGHFE